MTILLSGGGTLGSVTPLLALADTIRSKYPEASFIWVGTRRGPEREFLASSGIPYKAIHAGKFRRYVSFLNAIDIVRVIIGFAESLFLIWKHNPDVCISAGGFVSVPLHTAAWIFGVPTWIHQQDIRPGLANKIMKYGANRVTTVFEESAAYFPKNTTEWIGNFVRQDILKGDANRARRDFHVTTRLPIVLVTGGGTGALHINRVTVEALERLKGICEVIHIHGTHSTPEIIDYGKRHFASMYHPVPFLTKQMKDVYALADIIISRGGLGTLTEIAALKKTVIIIPKLGHQTDNARALERLCAARVMLEDISDGARLAGLIRELILDQTELKKIAFNLHHALPTAKNSRIMDILDTLVKS